jgi:hypothetical protein
MGHRAKHVPCRPGAGSTLPTVRRVTMTCRDDRLCPDCRTPVRVPASAPDNLRPLPPHRRISRVIVSPPASMQLGRKL